MTWFGRDPRIHWLDARDPDLVSRALEVVAAADAGDPAARTARRARRTLGS